MKWTTSAIISIVLLIALSMSVSACPSWCTPCKVEYGPYYVAQGEHITVTAPAGYSYLWTKYDVNGVGTPDGTAQTCVIDVPSTATTGQELGAVVTLTATHAGGPSCIATECIYLYVDRFTPPSLNDFCIHGAVTADADKFLPTVNTAHGFSGSWADGATLDVTKINGKSSSDIKTYLNGVYNAGPDTWTGGLAAGNYKATYTLKHGARTAMTCAEESFDVFALPSGPITLIQ
jgi:hypothetical protein